MIRQGHIGVYEFTALVTLAAGNRIFLSMGQVMAKLGKSAGWMIPLIATLTFIPAYYIYYRLLCLYPGESIVVIVDKVWGKWIALPVHLLFWLVTVIVGALTVRQFAETFITVALPQTPISVLIAISLAVAVYASNLGLEAIARTTFLVAPWILISTFVILAGVVPYLEPLYLFPLWGAGLPRIAVNGVLRSSVFLEILSVGLFAQSLRRPRSLLTVGILSTIISGTLLSLVTAIMLMATSIPLTENTPYPLYFLARQINFGRFFQRVEAIFIIIWFVVSAISVFLAFHGAVTLAAQALRLPFYQPLCLPTGIIMFAISLTPRNFVQARDLDTGFVRQYGSILLLFFVLTYLIALVRRKWGRRHAEASN